MNLLALMRDWTDVPNKVTPWHTMTPASRRQKIQELEDSCKSLESEHGANIEPNHLFSDGVYAREINVNAGTVLVGEVHMKPNLNILSKGKIVVATDEGIKVIEAPCSFVSPAGVKRVGFVLEDMVWTTIHGTELDDVDKIRNEFIAPSYEVYKQLEEQTYGLDSYGDCSGSGGWGKNV